LVDEEGVHGEAILHGGDDAQTAPQRGFVLPADGRSKGIARLRLKSVTGSPVNPIAMF